MRERARETEGRKLGGASLVPRIPTQSREETLNLSLPAARKGAYLGLRGGGPESRSDFAGKGERVCACACARVYELRGGAGRRGWPRNGGARRAAC